MSPEPSYSVVGKLYADREAGRRFHDLEQTAALNRAAPLLFLEYCRRRGIEQNSVVRFDPGASSPVLRTPMSPRTPNGDAPRFSHFAAQCSDDQIQFLARRFDRETGDTMLSHTVIEVGSGRLLRQSVTSDADWGEGLHPSVLKLVQPDTGDLVEVFEGGRMQIARCDGVEWRPAPAALYRGAVVGSLWIDAETALIALQAPPSPDSGLHQSGTLEVWSFNPYTGEVERTFTGPASEGLGGYMYSLGPDRHVFWRDFRLNIVDRSNPD